MADLAKLVVRLEAQSAQLLNELQKSNRSINKFADDTEKRLKKWSAGLLTYFSARSLLQFGTHVLEATDHLGDLSKEAGVTVESMSRLGYAAGQSGSDLDGLSTGLIKLSKTAADAAGGSKDAADAFKELGVSFKNTDGSLKSVDQLLLETADSFSKHADGVEKTALAQELFSKSGAKLIPFLNEGAAGIEELAKQADALGITISTKTQQAADDLNDSLATMKAAFEGAAATAIADVAPVLLELAKSFKEGAINGGEFSRVSAQMVTGLKLLIDVGFVTYKFFDGLGTLLGALGASAVAFASGRFKEAYDIIKQNNQDQLDDEKKSNEFLKKLWADEADAAVKSADTVAASTEKNANRPKFAIVDKEAGKQADAAIKKLKEMSEGLAEQIVTFGKGDAAATEYRLTLGKLSDDVAKAGATGKQLSAIIIEQAQSFERLQNQEAIKSIDAQIMQLKGHTVEAAAAMFDLQNATLKASLAATNDKAGLDALETLKQLTIAQEQYNKLELESQKIKDDLALTEDRIQNSQEVGALNELQALQALDAARKQAVDRLQEIADKQKAVADTSGNDALKRDSEKAGQAIEKLTQQTHLYRQKVRGDVEEIASDEFGAFLTGAKSASKAFADLSASIEAEAFKFLAKDVIRRFFNFLGGQSDGSTGSGFIGQATSFLGGLFGGSKDSGGRGQPGMAYAIGRGAQPEVYVPDQPGTFYPRGEGLGGGRGVTQNIYTSYPITTRSSRQLEIEAGRRQRISSSRLG